jgi:hypothetical protein
MNPKMSAKIYFLPEYQKERTVPFTGSRYMTTVRFNKDRTVINFSLIVDFTSPPDSAGWRTANVFYFAEQAPHHLLEKGNEFELLEGLKVTAKGVIL